ncbi:hypothetical protein DL93DRAFT_2232556 [Clavulina sp. PMI_390]|nr:hypothetical protein DL93DRAFT_2232556 [Clavulina sp. PMI_390]
MVPNQLGPSVPEGISPLGELPIEILITIMESLDIPSTIRLSMTSRALHDLVNSKPVALALVIACLKAENIPAAAWPLTSMGSKDLMDLATRRHRFVWGLDHLSVHERALAPIRRTDITFAIPSTGRADQNISVLPGGRWTVATTGSMNDWKFLCYDLQSEKSTLDGSCEPFIIIPLEHKTRLMDRFSIRCFEFCDRDSTFNVVIDCFDMTEDIPQASYWPELIRLHIEPNSDVLTYSLVPFPLLQHSLLRLHHLSGDFISFQDKVNRLNPEAIIWNWRKNTLSNPVEASQFVLTSAGSIVTMTNRFLHRGSATCRLNFNTWAQRKTENSEHADALDRTTLVLHQSHPLSFEFPGEDSEERKRGSVIHIEFHAELEDQLLIHIGLSGLRVHSVPIVVDKHSTLPRLITSSADGEEQERRISAYQAFFSNWFDTPPFFSCRITSQSVSSTTPDLPDELTLVQFLFYPKPAVALRNEDGDIALGTFYHKLFCSRSGRLLLPRYARDQPSHTNGSDGHKVLFPLAVIDLL